VIGEKVSLPKEIYLVHLFVPDNSNMVAFNPKSWLITILFVFLSANLCIGQIKWTSISPKMPYGDIISIAHGKNTFVTVGYKSPILTSPDGISWSAHYYRNNRILSSVAFGNNEFIAVGDSGKILTSPDGNNWTEVSLKKKIDLSCIIYDGTRFAAVGNDGFIATSRDAVNWEFSQTVMKISLTSIAFGNGIYVAVGSNGEVETSKDCLSWMPNDSAVTFAFLGSIAFGNNVFVAVADNGKIQRSADGITWTLMPLSSKAVSDIAFVNGQFFAAGSGNALFTSPDGIAWTARDSKASNKDGWLNAISYGNGRYIITSCSQRICISDDGVSWNEITKDSYNQLFGAAYGNDKFVCVGQNAIAVSSDGISWKEEYSPYIHKSVCFGKGLFVIAGDNECQISVSKDCKAFDSRGIGWRAHLEYITYLSGKFVALGCALDNENAIIAFSDSATEWSVDTIAKGFIPMSLAYGNNTYVVAGYSGPNCLFISKDGAHWKRANPTVTSYLYSVVFAGNQFVAVGENGTVLTSANGETWIKRDSLTGNSLRSVTFGDQHYVAVGIDAIISSPDGIVWQKEALEPDYMLFGIAYLKDRFLAFGGAGAMVVSGENVTGVGEGKKHDRGVIGLLKITYCKNRALFIPQLNDRNQCNLVTITAMNGKLMYSCRMKSVHGILWLPTERFPVGIYVVTVNNAISRLMQLMK
jgi:photosystem II stability/assembly factor-like uncharacterized protein